jgi:hypothetical protein
MARHTPVSWNLMIGRNPLLVAKEHGQHLTTMLSVYASWTEGAVEADVAAIRDSMIRTDAIERNAARDIPAMATRLDRLVTRPEGPGRTRRSDFSVADADPPPSDRFGGRFGTSGVPLAHKKCDGILVEREELEPPKG